jgi:hypothetical protein
MARPLPSGKQPVSLATDGVRVSRIRRDPPPVEKPKELRHPDDVNRSAVMIGVLAFALSIVVILLAFSAYTGRSPREYIVQM